MSCPPQASVPHHRLVSSQARAYRLARARPLPVSHRQRLRRRACGIGVVRQRRACWIEGCGSCTNPETRSGVRRACRPESSGPSCTWTGWSRQRCQGTGCWRPPRAYQPCTTQNKLPRAHGIGSGPCRWGWRGCCVVVARGHVRVRGPGRGHVRPIGTARIGETWLAEGGLELGYQDRT